MPSVCFYALDMANYTAIRVNTGHKYSHNEQLYVRYSTQKGVKYLKCVLESCTGRAVIKGDVFTLKQYHAEHATMTEEIQRLQVAAECRSV